MVFFNEVAHGISSYKKIKSLTIRLFISDSTGSVYFTDLFLQGGSIATGWIGHISEIKWTLDG